MSLPICEFLAIPARLHTGSPHMRKGVGFDLYTRVTNGKGRRRRPMKTHVTTNFYLPTVARIVLF